MPESMGLRREPLLAGMTRTRVVMIAGGAAIAATLLIALLS